MNNRSTLLPLLLAGLLFVVSACGQKAEQEVRSLRARLVVVETEWAELRKEVTRLEARLAKQSQEIATLSHTHPEPPPVEHRPAPAVEPRPAPEAGAVADVRKERPAPAKPSVRTAPVGARKPLRTPPPDPEPEVEEKEERPPQGPGVWEADEPFMRVGSRAGFVEVTEYVEEMPEILTRWLRAFLKSAGLNAQEGQAVAAAISPSIDVLQDLGRSYLQGAITKEDLRSRFWSEFAAAEGRLAKVLSEAELVRLKESALAAVANDEYLPLVLGEAPAQ